MLRREFLCSAPAFLATSAWGEETPLPAIARYEQASGGHIGFHAEDTGSGRTLSWRADDRFVMCSTFKASLAALILQRADRRQEDLEARIPYGSSDIQGWWAPVAEANLHKGFLTVREMCAAAVEYSDNTCANLLLTRVGGPAAITAFWRAIGDGTSRLDDPEPYLNRTPLGGVRNTTTPRVMAANFRRFVLGDVLTIRSRKIFTAWLLASQTGSDRLRSGLPKAWTTGDKTGNNGADAAGDIAVTWPPSRPPIIIAAYTRGGAPTQAQLQEVFGAIGRLAAAEFTR